MQCTKGRASTRVVKSHQDVVQNHRADGRGVTIVLDVSKSQCQKQLIPGTIAHRVHVKVLARGATDPLKYALIPDIIDCKRGVGATSERCEIVARPPQQRVLVLLAV